LAKNFRREALQTMWLLTHKRDFLEEYAEHVKVDYFGNAAERFLVRAAIEHFRAHDSVISEAALDDALTEADESGELEQINLEPDDIWSIYDDLDAVRKDERRYVYSQIAVFLKHQNLKNLLTEASAALNKDGPDAAQGIVDRARGTLQIVEQRSGSLFHGAKAALERIGVRELEDDHIPTGIPKLDGLMEGGIRPGEVGVFLCRTGGGKTMWLCQTAAMAVLRGIEVAYYTLEVDRDEIWLRSMASASTVHINDLRAYAMGSSDPDLIGLKLHKDSPTTRIKKMRKSLALIGGGERDLWIEDIAVRGAGLDTIFHNFEKLVQTGKNPKLVVIDYADRLRPSGKYDRRHEGQEEVYQELQAIAKEKNIAIWTAAQANRQAIKTAHLTLDKVQGSFNKLFECSFVLAA